MYKKLYNIYYNIILNNLRVIFLLFPFFYYFLVMSPYYKETILSVNEITSNFFVYPCSHFLAKNVAKKKIVATMTSIGPVATFK